jgi:hypothetical protein
LVLGLLDADTPEESVNARGFQSVELPSGDGSGNSPAWSKATYVGEDVVDFGVAIEEHDLLFYITCITK